MRAATVTVVIALSSCAGPAPVGQIAFAAQEPPPCDAVAWVAAWSGPASDASRADDATANIDPSLKPINAVNDSTVRALATPNLGGSTIRVHLSNRFGVAPVTFDHATVAQQASGPAIVAASLTDLSFNGSPSVTVAPGADIVSDGVAFSFEAGQPLAVSVFVAGDIGKPTTHYTARQTSYLTPQHGGDQTTEIEGAAFTLSTTSRPFLTGIDAEATASVGSVVTFGDSITDGYQGQAPDGAPETLEGLDARLRYPDLLADRLRDADAQLSVVNAGISGNRVLLDGADGANRETNGASALHRVRTDVMDQAGATTVVLLEGINDLGKTPQASAGDLIAGYTALIDELHTAGLAVVHGTLTPAGGSTSYGTPAIEAERQQVNTWIRTESPADSIADFDVAVRDASDPSRLDPRFDGGDHLHMSPAGNQAMANAVPLDQLRPARCTRPQMPETRPQPTRQEPRLNSDSMIGSGTTTPNHLPRFGFGLGIGLLVIGSMSARARHRRRKMSGE